MNGAEFHGPWFVVQTKPRQELRARENLERQGFRCVLPMLEVEKIRGGRVQWGEEPLFARYLFVELGEGGGWNVVRSTRGVAQLVQFGGAPARMPAQWIAEFLAGERRRVALFEPGSKVVVRSGPFTGLEAVYHLRDGDARAVVLLELLGKLCELRLPLGALRRAA